MGRKGAKVSIWDINLQAAKKVQQEMEREGFKAFSQECDVTSRQQVYTCGDNSERVFGRVDILINNAGIVNGKPMLELSEEQIIRCIKVNTIALHWTV